MFQFNAIDFELMGRVVTLDVVTFCGMVCVSIVSFSLLLTMVRAQKKKVKLPIKKSISRR